MSDRPHQYRATPRVVGGFFAEHPHLLADIPPIANLLSAGEVRFMREHPQEACEEFNTALNAALAEYRGNLIRGDDPHERMEALLRLDNPLAPVLDMLNRLRENRVGSPDMQATRLRCEALAHICSQRALRAGTLVQLTCGPGGDLGWQSGQLVLDISKKKFKNSNSRRFKDEDYRKVLRDIHGCYETLDRWLHARRTLIVPGEADGFLFVTRGGNKPMSEALLANTLRALHAEFLCRAEFGADFDQIVPFGPHGYRHIVATYFLKMVQNPWAAAESIDDEAKTIMDHYTRYLASDVRALVESTWQAIACERR